MTTNATRNALALPALFAGCALAAFVASRFSDFLSSAWMSGIIYPAPFVSLAILSLFLGRHAGSLVSGGVAAGLTLVAHYSVTSLMMAFSPPGDPNIGAGLLYLALPVVLLVMTAGGCLMGAGIFGAFRSEN